MGGICPLFFDGAVCQFNELPRPENKVELQKIYKYLETIRENPNKSFFTYFKNKFKN